MLGVVVSGFPLAFSARLSFMAQRAFPIFTIPPFGLSGNVFA